MPYQKTQNLNDWVSMLHSIYGLSQNYSRSDFEICAHISEVTGAFGKYLFKLRQPEKAKPFLPKMFGWGAALLKKLKGEAANFETVILTKYPCVCPYCAKAPCGCIPGKKVPIDDAKIRDLFHRKTPTQRRSLNDFQAMFRSIYEQSWGLKNTKSGTDEAYSRLQQLYTRLTEEVSEVTEAVRFAHLYPSNFDNELADFIAWVFALASSLHKADPREDAPMALVEELFWPAYPGICTVCLLDVCDCRPSPVRELLSKPSLREREYIDSLTQAANQGRMDRDIDEIAKGMLPLPVPLSCVRIDVDDFKRFNEAPFNHSVGDEALKHLVTVVRQKIRTRDRLYRPGGDEFAVLCPDLSADETRGMMSRVAAALKEKPIPALGQNNEIPPTITLSVGISECNEASKVKSTFELADQAAGESKTKGKDRITIMAAPKRVDELPQ